MKFVDIFAGSGFLRMGLEQAGHECVYSIEWDKNKRKIYSIIFGGEPHGKDIRGIRASDIPKSDFWAFGFPCQDISTAGEQEGLDGEKSGMFWEVHRLLKDKKESDRPQFLLIENVANLLRINGGWDFFKVLNSLGELGYYFPEYELLNSKDFGVPLYRERIFITGCLRNKCA